MRIRTLLALIAAASVVFPAVIGTLAVLATQRTNAIAAQGAQAHALIEGSFVLDTFAQAYVARPHARPQAQWRAQYALLERTLSSPVLADDPSGSRLPALREDLAAIRRSFDDLVAAAEASAPDPELQRLVAGDLLAKMQRLITEAGATADAAFAAQAAARARTDRLIFFMLAALAVAATSTLVFLAARILGPIARLQRGTDIVGRGDLSHRIGGTGDDEIARLARAFDGMTARLKESYDSLEAKVRTRTRELQDLSDRHRQLLESIGDGVLAIDRAWTVTLWNPAAERLTGWKREEALGKPLREVAIFLYEHSGKENVSFIEDAMIFGEPRSITEKTVLVRRDGRQLPIGDSAAPIRDEGGAVVGAIVVFRDATLEREAMEMRSDFTYAAHQLRTPVTKAMWSVEEAMAHEERPDVRKTIEEAYFALKSVVRLNDQLLLVSQLDQNLVHPDREYVPLQIFVAGVAKDATAQCRAHNLALRTPTVPQTWGIETDPRMLRRVVDEVLDNAVAYAADRSTITLDVSERDDGFLLEVRNTGIGIQQEQHPLVFTKFFRGSNFDTTRIIGAGLGLYIAREYLRLLGGKIWFTSVEGGETVFSVFLPREPAGTV